jgi:glycosyltransferase involved in cell wall biosynthesis
VRVAWVGPDPEDSAGVPYVATQLLLALARQGVELDCFLTLRLEDVPEALRREPGLRLVCVPPRFAWDRWYSRGDLRGLVTYQGTRVVAQARLATLLAERHRAAPYDLLYQFSQLELFFLRRLRRSLPPIVLHPQVHAAGELRWHHRETPLALRSERRVWHLSARAMLAARAAMQRRDVQLAETVIAPSKRFADDVSRDYAVPLDRFVAIPNPADLERYRPFDAGSAHTGKLRLLFVSRLAVRKGVEMVVELSHRLVDVSDRVHIDVAGAPDMWSNYRGLLRDLEPDLATYWGSTFEGTLSPERLRSLYRSAHALLQPSHYEPFALTVAEALASGVPVVASDAVGAAEEVDRRCCCVFPAGDASRFESSVRGLLARLDTDEAPALRALARAEAERLFSLPAVAGRVEAALEATIERASPRSLRTRLPTGRSTSEPPTSSAAGSGRASVASGRCTSHEASVEPCPRSQ